VIDELPQGWESVKLADITSKVGSGATPRGGSESYEAQGIPLIRSMNVRFEGFTTDGLAFLSGAQAKALDAVEVKSDDVLLNITGASIGRVTQAPASMHGARVNQHVCIIRPKPELDAAFLARFLASSQVQRLIRTEQYGVTRQALTKGQVLNFDIPLPSLSEQRRIVAKLEILLRQVHACQHRLAKIPTLLKRFRQSVLAAACSGRLAVDWRENGSYEDDLPAGWRRTPLEQLLPPGGIFDGPFGSNLKSSDYTNSGVRVIRLENVGQLRFISEKQTFVSREKYASLERHTVSEGDIIFASFISEEIRACILPKLSTKAIAKADCFCLRPDPKLVSDRYLVLQLVSRESYDRLHEEVHGATRPRINTTQLRKLEVKVCPMTEQMEIVRRVESLFALADRIETRFAEARKRVDSITQAILAKAFRGELVPTEAELAAREGRSYESASELLDRIRVSATHANNGDASNVRKKRAR
jgi:type I restriction enzyme, S subunit